MSNFPQCYDDDTTLPVVNDNLTEIGGEAINALRDAVVNIEMNIGLGAAGTTPSIAARLGLLINPDGTPNVSTITSLGLVTLPIYNYQIADNAGIQESKLQLDYSTLSLFNYIRDLSRDVNLALGWISVSGVKLEPHLIGAIYRHDLAQIDVAENPSQYLNNVFGQQRNNTNSYYLINDINNELLAHQWADGSPLATAQNITTNDGGTYSSIFAHTSSGIFLSTSSFTTVPQTADNLQLFAEYVDSSSLLLLGSRVQNLYSNGISRNSRSSSLTQDGYGQQIIPPTLATTFLLNTGNSTSPVDDINNGDDIVAFMPSGNDGYLFASQFASVNIGDILRVNYGTVEVDFVILEKKFIPQVGGDGYSTFIVRIDGKNLEYSTTAMASVNRPLFNQNKYGVLAMAGVNTTGITDNSVNVMPSLIIGSPRGAQALGIGFDASQFDGDHYLLYLALYPDGIPSDGYLILPGIDVTGNAGTTPGQYTLNSVVAATNAAFRQPGYNYRFIAFEYQGEFGIMLADSYNDASFSILSVVLDVNGNPSSTATNTTFTNNVIGVLPDANGNTPDPLGLGPSRANLASPPYQSSFSSLAVALQPTRLFVPLKRNNYYVDGVEQETMSIDVDQSIDGYGDGYWLATVTNISTMVAGTVEVTYTINLDLSTSQLKAGKTLVIQSVGEGGTFPTDFGRYIIKDVTFFTDCPTCSVVTQVTVYDAVHGIGLSPSPVLSIGSVVGLYFNSSAVSFDTESATDFGYYSPFKRYFEVFIDEFANTFTHERGRTNVLGSNQTINAPPGTILVSGIHSLYFDMVNISPKLQGYTFSSVTKITLLINSFTPSTGIYDGYLCAWSGNISDPKTNFGPLTSGKQGQVVRFYDESNIDYIDFELAAPPAIFPNLPAFSNEAVDVQLFPSLQLDQQVMILGSCQVNMQTQSVSYLTDLRQFGNTSEEQLTTSALDYIAAPTRLLSENGIIRGFDCLSVPAPTFTALSGTFTVTQGSPNITASTAPSINAGSIVQFSTSTISYVVLSVVGTAIVLTTNYLGTSTTTATGTYAITFPNEMLFDGGEAVVNGNIVQLDPQSITIPIVQEIIAPNSLGSGIPNNVITWFVCVTDEGDFTMIASTDFNPNSAIATSYYTNGLNETRLFYAINPNVPVQNPYVIRSSYLSDIVQNQRDLAVVGVVTATIAVQVVNGSPSPSYQLVSAVYSDARRYIYNGYGGLATPFVLSPNGSFQTLAALNTWLTQLTTLQSTVDIANDVGINVIVKGNNILSAPVNLSYGREVTFQGDGGVFSIDSIPTGITLGNNITFRNVRFDYEFNPVGDGIYLTTQLSNPSKAAIYCTVDPTNGNTNIKFDQCWFTSSLQYRYAFVTFNFAASSCYAQNISFTDNKFITSYATADDQLAAVSFVGPGTNPTTGNGARLINCEISGNYCNKDQMLLIASPLVGSSILDLIACVNTTITNNICGAINVMSKQDYPLSVYNSAGFNLDKGAGLIVSGNTCKYIFSGFADGNLTDNSGNRAIYDIQDGFSLTTCATSFTENTIYFMHVGYRIVPSSMVGVPKFVVRNNKFIAYSASYLTPYFRNIVQTSASALIVDKATGT